MDTENEHDDAYYQKRKKVIILAATAVVITVEHYRKHYLGKESYRSVSTITARNQIRMGKRACSAVTSGRKKRRKVETDKVSNLLKAIATVISQLVSELVNDSPYDLAKRLCVAIDAIPGLDFNKRLHAKVFFMKRKNLARLFLNASEEDKPKVLELCMSDSKDISKDF